MPTTEHSNPLAIPAEYSEAASRGLRQAFGVDAPEEIRDLTERPGSNRAFCIVVQGGAYLLRINTRRGDVRRQFACMQAAADAGLAPRVWYTSVEDRVSITDFVQAIPQPIGEALVRIPAALRALHALDSFPSSPSNTTCTFLLNEGPAREQFLAKFRDSNALPAKESAELLSCYERIARVYSRLRPDMAPSHNDLFKPDNMLFDGTRLWMVDWEAAFQNDRYADLAAVANMIVGDEDGEARFSREYFGAAPDAYQSARLYLMRQVAHLFYAMAFLTAEPLRGRVPEYQDFRHRFWAGEFQLTDSDAKALFGRVHFNRLSENLRQPRFEEALHVLSE